MSNIWFAGDTHGRFEHLIAAVKAHRPIAVVLLGDVQSPRPLHIELAEVLALTQVHWIPGNHDCDTEADFDNLFASDLRDRNLHGRVVNIAGVSVGGLGGIFRERVWMPPAEPTYASAADLLRATKRNDRWRGGLPLRHRSTIFQDEYLRMARMQADVLVTHEAPGFHPQGNAAFELLAASMGVRALFHGHHHDALDYSKASANAGFAITGVGLRGITAIDGTRIVEGERDVARAHRRAWDE